MKKVISYSLWGNNPKYTIGAVRNAEFAKKIYPNWKCRFYVDLTVPKNILFELEDLSNVEIIYKNCVGDWSSMFWRFEASYDPSVSVSIFRDSDSRLSMREKEALDEWLSGNKTFHIMRDHPWHLYPILGGMWGVKNDNDYNLENLISQFYKNSACNKYGTDYDFFTQVLFPLVNKDACIHDEFFDKKPFPSKRKNFNFVGQVFDENEETVEEHVRVLQKELAS